jgi:hypothetical protein
MFGLGTDGAQAYDWARQYADAFNEMGKPTVLCRDKTGVGLGRVAFGTDTNSLVTTPRPPMADLNPGFKPPAIGRSTDLYNPNNHGFPQTMSRTGLKTWDYNVDGVAHYGMYADFIKDVRSAPVNQGMSGADLVDNHLMRSADYFWHMWQRIEAQKSRIPQ